MKTEQMKLKLKIAGKDIPLVPFVHDALRDMIIAFTGNLKGHSGGKIEIIIQE
ncbi:MAG: hypothetical protein JW784_00155 [Candidatus Cloacimonetes bacterium]|nr:hypothetical protein [Candidatus Cloacimonadota bacterium]